MQDEILPQYDDDAVDALMTDLFEVLNKHRQNPLVNLTALITAVGSLAFNTTTTREEALHMMSVAGNCLNSYTQVALKEGVH